MKDLALRMEGSIGHHQSEESRPRYDEGDEPLHVHTCHLGCLSDTQAVDCAGRWVNESGLQGSSRLTVHMKQLSVYTRYEMARVNLGILGISELKWTGMVNLT